MNWKPSSDHWQETSIKGNLVPIEIWKQEHIGDRIHLRVSRIEIIMEFIPMVVTPQPEKHIQFLLFILRLFWLCWWYPMNRLKWQLVTLYLLMWEHPWWSKNCLQQHLSNISSTIKLYVGYWWMYLSLGTPPFDSQVIMNTQMG